MLIFDGHLDLAMNALSYERDQTLAVRVLREREGEGGVSDGRGLCGVTLPAMRAGGVGLCVATAIARCKPWIPPDRVTARLHGDWPAADMAHAVGMAHLAYYRRLEARGEIAVLTTREAVRGYVEAGEPDASLADSLSVGVGAPRPIGVILTLEGADPITHPEELHLWHEAGVRSLMLAHFGQSRYAHGTPSDDPTNTHDIDGPLTDLGRELLGVMHDLDMPLDVTHLSDRSLAEATDRFPGRVYSSHSACRSLCPTVGQRNHTDEHIRLIAQRGGVMGVPLFNAFLTPDYRQDSRKQDVSLDRVVDHLDHITQLTGSIRHAAIGSDLDGGFGIEHTPRELDTIADLPRLADALRQRGHTDADIAAVMSGNWIEFWSHRLLQSK